MFMDYFNFIITAVFLFSLFCLSKTFDSLSKITQTVSWLEELQEGFTQHKEPKHANDIENVAIPEVVEHYNKSRVVFLIIGAGIGPTFAAAWLGWAANLIPAQGILIFISIATAASGFLYFNIVTKHRNETRTLAGHYIELIEVIAKRAELKETLRKKLAAHNTDSNS